MKKIKFKFKALLPTLDEKEEDINVRGTHQHETDVCTGSTPNTRG